MRKRLIKEVIKYYKTLPKETALKKEFNIQNPSWNFYGIAGIGDAYILCGLLKNFKNKADIPINYIAINKVLAKVAGLFSKGIDNIFTIPETRKATTKFLTKNRLIDSCFYNHVTKNSKPLKNMADGYRRMLKLDVNTPISELELNVEAKAKTDTLAEKLGLNGQKSLLISPHAESTEITVSNENWLKIAKYFESLDYQVFFNSNDAFFEKNGQCIFPEISTIPYLVDNFTKFIGYRSGFCDIVAGTSKTTELVIFYPNFEQGKGDVNFTDREHLSNLLHKYYGNTGKENLSELYLRACCLNDMFNRTDIKEVLMHDSEIDNFLRENI